MTDHRIAELDDLDRADMEVLTFAEFQERAALLRQIIADRWVTEANAAALLAAANRERNERRAILIFCLKWLTVGMVVAAFALYLKSIGQ